MAFKAFLKKVMRRMIRYGATRIFTYPVSVVNKSIVEVDSPLEALEVVTGDIPGRGPGSAAVGPFSLDGGLAVQQIGEGPLDVRLVVVVGVDVEVVDAVQAAEFVEQVPLLPRAGRVAAGDGEARVGGFDERVED